MEWNELKIIMLSRWRDLHGKSRYLSLLLSILLGGIGYLIVVLVREHASYHIYQLLVLCFIALALLTFGTLYSRESEEYKES